MRVTVVLDRSGVTGPDGASHNGMWDGSILQVSRPADRRPPRRSRIAELLSEAIEVSDGPTVLRWPKGTGARRPRRSASSAAWTSCDARRGAGRDVLLLGAGPMAVTCVEVAQRLQATASA